MALSAMDALEASGFNHSPILPYLQYFAASKFFGEGEIRTREGHKSPSGFQDRYAQPLRDLSSVLSGS